MNSKEHIPPRIAHRILLSFLRDDFAEDVSGDLEEKFYLTLKTKSSIRAKLNYWYQVFHYLRPFAFRKSRSKPINPLAMYRSYFKTTIRNLVKNKMLAGINIVGLSIGMAVSLTIGLWIWDEWSFNSTHEKSDRIAQVIQNVTNNGEVQTWFAIPWPLADELRKNYGSDFEQVVLTTGANGHLVTTPTKKFTKSGLYAEPGFGEMFSMDMIAGSSDALTDPSSVLLSESTAKAYFDGSDPVNQILKIDETFTVKVAGVYKNFPYNSSFSGTDFIASWEMLYKAEWIKGMDDPWRPNAFNLYVRLTDHADFVTASAKIRDAKLRRVNPQLAKKKPMLFLHPMDRWHLYPEFKDGANVGGGIQYVWLFGTIGIFVLLMACINFMNLTTARSEQRAKEVGIRKSVGSFRGQLVAQFFTESISVALLSFFFALVFVWISLPLFNQMANKQMELPWDNPIFWLIGLGFSFLTGLVSGSYPAFYLSAIQPGRALKGLFRAGPSASLPRKALVVLQFAISVVLIVGTVTVFQQIQYAKNRPIGYNRDALVSSRVINDVIHKHFEAFRAELEKTGAVVSVAEASAPPTESSSSTSGLDWKGKDPNLSVDFNNFGASAEYGKTVGWEVVKGRDFSGSIPSDSAAIILNEAAASYMGFKEPIGEVIRWWGNPLQVIGVVKNMVFNSPYEPVRPSLYYLSKDQGGFVVMKINPGRSASEAVAQLEKIFKQFNPDEPFTYQFADGEYSKKFGNEDRIGKLAAIFTMLAIFISCLGIFGLSSFVAEQRTKEIGVRKVLGASVYDLWSLLSKDFVFLVLFSCLVAAPVAYYAMNTWLMKYNYRTAFAWWVLAVSCVATLSITLLTVSFHTIHAAKMKPVKSLRNE